MLRAAAGPCRTACWAVPPAVPRSGSGTAAQSPTAQTRSVPSTRRYSSTGTLPRSSSGTESVRRLGCGATPAVQTTVRVGLHRVGGEVLQLGQRLQPGVAPADEHVGEQPLAAGRVLAVVGRLQCLD